MKLWRQLRGRAGPRVLGVQPVAVLRPPPRASEEIAGLPGLRRRSGASGRRPLRRGHPGRRYWPGSGRGHPQGSRGAHDEDIHSWVEARLTERIGDLAGQAHLGRSRNEQSVTALRLWIRGAIDALRADTARLVRALAEKGTSGADAVMPGFTHTRVAEPITLGHFVAGHTWGLVRDHERLGDARRRVNVLPLGSGALAGTAVPLDRDALARDLGFEAVSPSALDAVMDRDFAAESCSRPRSCRRT